MSRSLVSKENVFLDASTSIISIYIDSVLIRSHIITTCQLADS